jgi:hypothetical protein
VGDKLSDPIDEVKRKREKELEKVVDRTCQLDIFTSALTH